MKKTGVVLIILLLGVATITVNGKEKVTISSNRPSSATNVITFIELGSVRCIPCKMMQPIMKQVETNYSGKVKVVFYDVWTPAGQPAAEQYQIRLIPTQVFLDGSGKEFYRHEGFFAYDEIKKILKEKGINPARENR